MTEENWQTVTGKSAMVKPNPDARDSTFSIVDIDL
jgi:ATP synthase subunit C